tara:strand:- start:200 stop:592 length:393 start_codon:yes stop_codon:yes gene_type:complete
MSNTSHPQGDTLYLSRQIAARLTDFVKATKSPIIITNPWLAQALFMLKRTLPLRYDNAPYADLEYLFTQYPGFSISFVNENIAVGWDGCNDNPLIPIELSMLGNMLCPTSRATLRSIVDQLFPHDAGGEK